VVQHHPDRTLADFRRIGGCALRHSSILARVGASGKPGAVQWLQPHTIWGALVIILARVGAFIALMLIIG